MVHLGVLEYPKNIHHANLTPDLVVCNAASHIVVVHSVLVMLGLREKIPQHKILHQFFWGFFPRRHHLFYKEKKIDGLLQV